MQKPVLFKKLKGRLFGVESNLENHVVAMDVQNKSFRKLLSQQQKEINKLKRAVKDAEYIIRSEIDTMELRVSIVAEDVKIVKYGYENFNKDIQHNISGTQQRVNDWVRKYGALDRKIYASILKLAKRIDKIDSKGIKIK